jgi:hypothetical protein
VTCTSAQEAQRYLWIVYQYGDLTRKQINQMESDNPSIHLISYMDPWTSSGITLGCVASTTVNTTHPGWHVDNSGGAAIGGVMDPGSTSYQDQCYANRVAHDTDATYGGCNGGAFWDDVRNASSALSNENRYIAVRRPIPAPATIPRRRL